LSTNTNIQGVSISTNNAGYGHQTLIAMTRFFSSTIIATNATEPSTVATFAFEILLQPNTNSRDSLNI
jgi:hypothetical protein